YYTEKTYVIGAFNIRAFSVIKSANESIMRIIKNIIRSYDIILCQEIHAPQDEIEFIKELVESISTSSTPYTYTLSDPVGRDNERYLYIYKEKVWRLNKAYIINEEKLDVKFIRNPYIAKFQYQRHSEVWINLVGYYTEPRNAYYEVRANELFSMDELIYAFDNLINKSDNFSKFVSERKESRKKVFDEPIIMIGDFDTSDLRKDEYTKVDRLLQQNELVLVGLNASYDQFIFEKKVKKKMIKSVKVWRFNKDWSYNDLSIVEEATKLIFNNFPIKFVFKL
ncbi:14834_t:CDS:2, partial [Racocetra persica]